MRPINTFLLKNNLSLATNPCVSPDFCLDWPSLRAKVANLSLAGIVQHAKSGFETTEAAWMLVEDPVTGDCAWLARSRKLGETWKMLKDGLRLDGRRAAFPATWENLLSLKNLIQAHDPQSTIFPTAEGSLGQGTLGIGARFTTLHWPAVAWAMSALDLGVTANQNSIPRELVYDADAMLEGRLGTVAFPFIGTSVPEGHQGQSVEGMSHGSVLTLLKSGFHRRRIAWAFNADHQPIGGAFDEREDALVRGCALASYITFDLSPELALERPATVWELDAAVVARVRDRLLELKVDISSGALESLVCRVWPALCKMKRRDEKYRQVRERLFSSEKGRRYLRELSIDELPGITAPETTAVMLALCEAMGMAVNYVAPAFGLQKNTPYADTAKLRAMIEAQWSVASLFGVGIGFHSGSGKSQENYRIMGEVTGCRLEIKTSGRYTYEMGRALERSSDANDRLLWQEWYRFTREMALSGAFSEVEAESRMARHFVEETLRSAGRSTEVFGSMQECREALEALAPSADHMIFFEYNFLFVLAERGRAEKSALGCHSPEGYRQRARFYAISAEARLLYAKAVASYIIFLAASTGLRPKERCEAAMSLLGRMGTYQEFVDAISR